MQKYWRHCTVFWRKWLVHDLVLVTPPPPLFKVACNTRPCSKLGGTTLKGGRGKVSMLSHRPVTTSDLKQDRLFFRERVSTFLQLVVAFSTVCRILQPEYKNETRRMKSPLILQWKCIFPFLVITLNFPGKVIINGKIT